MKTVGALLAALAAPALAQELCDQYGYYSSSGYEFNNNNWGKDSGTGSQCTTVDGADSGGVSWHSTWSWSGGDDDVKAYPYSGREISDIKLVSDVGSLPSAATWTYSGDNVRANVAYDLFTAADPNHDPSSGDYELMIWLARVGDVYPIGSSTGTVNVGGNDWDLYVGMNGDMNVFSFVAPSERESFDNDVKLFFNYIADNQEFPATSQYLLTAQFGSEAFTGDGATFTVTHWDAAVN